jgi:hypothetical protein
MLEFGRSHVGYREGGSTSGPRVMTMRAITTTPS